MELTPEEERDILKELEEIDHQFYQESFQLTKEILKELFEDDKD